MVKLIVHIGHGKTGSSSIQETLLASRQALTDQGVAYLGLMLEHSQNTVRPAWQQRSGSDAFFAVDHDSAHANDELFAVLQEALSLLDAHGVTRAIWSNEWLAQRSRMVLPALQRVAAQGHTIEIQCYIRRHDKWAISAYSQWGLKHKNYAGPIRRFADWLPIFGGRGMRFAGDLAPWDNVFGQDLRVFNFDAVGDVVEHFLMVNHLQGIVPIRDNVSPPSVEIAAQAVFNSRSEAPVRPFEYGRIAALLQRETTRGDSLPTIDALFPDAKTLADILEERCDDIAALDQMLQRSGQPRLDFSDPPRQTRHPDPWEMEQYILRLLFGLADEVRDLRQQVVELRRHADNN